jgi:hypothetical protein
VALLQVLRGVRYLGGGILLCFDDFQYLWRNGMYIYAKSVSLLRTYFTNYCKYLYFSSVSKEILWLMAVLLVLSEFFSAIHVVKFGRCA